MELWKLLDIRPGLTAVIGSGGKTSLLRVLAQELSRRGIDAIGEVTVRITAEDGKVYTGRGADTDIIVSSAKAYVNAVNRMIQTARSKEGK